MHQTYKAVNCGSICRGQEAFAYHLEHILQLAGLLSLLCILLLQLSPVSLQILLLLQHLKVLPLGLHNGNCRS